jgi:hypothetical protein
MSSFTGTLGPHGGSASQRAAQARASGRLFVFYGRLLGPLLGGSHVRQGRRLSAPAWHSAVLGEMVLGVGALAAIIETRHSQQRRAVNQDQVE